jgi:predicted RNA-binding protein YlxR (DUF448 family)
LSEENTSLRTCVLTKKQGTRETLLRLVLSPEGQMFADIDAVLPGRGLWVKLDQTVLREGVKSGKLLQAAARGFARSPKAIEISDDFEARVEDLLRQRCLSAVGLERRAGRVVLGQEKVRAAAQKGQIALLCVASDAGADGLAKVRSLRLPDHVPVLSLFNRDDLGLALGRENVVQAAVTGHGLSGGLTRWLKRLWMYYGLNEQQTGLSEDANEKVSERNE